MSLPIPAEEYRQRPHPQLAHLVWPDGSVCDCAEQELGVVLAQACVQAWEEQA